MNKKIILLVILVLSLTMIFAGCTSAGKNVVNGDFSSFSEKENFFEGWTGTYDPDLKADDKKSVFGKISPETTESDQDKGHGNYVVVNASKAGVNVLTQEIKLDQGATYRLSVDIKTQGTITGESSKFRGAWVGFMEDAAFAIQISENTNNVWHSYEKYFTPATSKTLTLAVGLGHPEAGKAKGKAFFDNIVLEKVDATAVPKDSVVETVKFGGDKYSLADGGSTAFVVVGAILSVMIIAAFMYVYRKTMSREMLSTKKGLSPLALFIYMMIVAFLVRFLIAIFTGGMVSELNRLTNLALKFNSTAMKDVVGATSTTLPTGMLYLLWALGGIAKVLPIGGDGLALLIRLPFILADLVAVYMIYNMLSKRIKEHSAIFVAGLYAILPSVIMASTGWGMAMSLVGCLLIGMYYCMLNKNYIGVTALFTVSLMFSNMTVLLLPLVLAFLINAFVKYSDSRLKIGLSSLIALVAFYCLAIPFVVNELGHGKPFYMFELMFKDLTLYNVLTANAFGLYGMVGQNLAKIPVALDVLNYIFVVAIMVATILMYLKNRDRLNIILMSAFTLISVSTLCIRGNIETMVLGIVLLFVYASVANSRRAYALVGGFSTLSFLNMSLIMSNSGFISNQLNSSNLVSFFRLDASFIIFSLIAVAMTLYMGYMVYDVCVRDRSVEIAPLDGKLKDDFATRWQLFKDRMKNRKVNNVEEETEVEE